MNAVTTGYALEEKAAQYLQKLGFYIISRNFRCKHGEIDLIATHEQKIVFLEVRYRNSCSFGHPAESVTQRKQQKIIASANFFLQTKPWVQHSNCRFDVIAMTKNVYFPQIEWIKDAFNA